MSQFAGYTTGVLDIVNGAAGQCECARDWRAEAGAALQDSIHGQTQLHQTSQFRQ